MNKGMNEGINWDLWGHLPLSNISTVRTQNSQSSLNCRRRQRMAIHSICIKKNPWESNNTLHTWQKIKTCSHFSITKHTNHPPSNTCSHFLTSLLLLWRTCPTPEAHRCTHATDLPHLNPVPTPRHLNPSLWNDQLFSLSCISPISIQTNVPLQKLTDTHSLISDAPYIKAKLISFWFSLTKSKDSRLLLFSFPSFTQDYLSQDWSPIATILPGTGVNSESHLNLTSWPPLTYLLHHDYTLFLLKFLHLLFRNMRLAWLSSSSMDGSAGSLQCSVAQHRAPIFSNYTS